MRFLSTGLVPRLAHDVIDVLEPTDTGSPILLIVCALAIAAAAAFIIYKRNHDK